MSIETSVYQDILQPEPADYTEWKTSALQNHLDALEGRLLTTDVPRQQDEVGRSIEHISFELRERRKDFEQFMAIARATGPLAVEGA